jgi:hypothetical protein
MLSCAEATTTSYSWNTSATNIVIGNEIVGNGHPMSGVIVSFRSTHVRYLLLKYFQLSSRKLNFQYRVSTVGNSWSVGIIKVGALAFDGIVVM